ncbi:MAG TPA: GNAT family protein, partial [Pyrinomonadaceae bacterium]|nr:GNAT family protein [Pyrinomonadaceae bacterium]
MMIRLRRTAEGDLDFVLAAEGAEDNRRFVSQWTRGQHREAMSHPDLAHLVVESVEDGRSVGYVIMAGLRDANRAVEFRRVVITDKGKGYGREVLRAVKKMAFRELKAHRLWLDVKEHNRRARLLYESEGFVVEGVLRECVSAGGGWESLVLMSVLEQEYGK